MNTVMIHTARLFAEREIQQNLLAQREQEEKVLQGLSSDPETRDDIGRVRSAIYSARREIADLEKQLDNALERKSKTATSPTPTTGEKMKLSLTTNQFDLIQKARAGLDRELQFKPVRFVVNEDGITAIDAHNNEIGFVNTSGMSPGNGWIQSQKYGSESIHVDLAA